MLVMFYEGEQNFLAYEEDRLYAIVAQSVPQVVIGNATGAVAGSGMGAGCNDYDVEWCAA